VEKARKSVSRLLLASFFFGIYAVLYDSLPSSPKPWIVRGYPFDFLTECVTKTWLKYNGSMMWSSVGVTLTIGPVSVLDTAMKKREKEEG
jgi:hypothetical protein